ncbi:MAG: GGDEF domain-containing protein [Gammaproteobacteria bacterium]
MKLQSRKFTDVDLEKQELFKAVDFETIKSFVHDCPVKEVKKDETLIKVGDPNHHLYLILSGRFRVHLASDTINPVAILETGQSIGEISIIDHQPASADVIAETDARILVLDEEILWSLVEQSHAIAYNLLVILAQRLRFGNTVINKIKELLTEYERSATIDPLTNLFNRRWLDSMQERVLQRCATNNQPLSVLMIDIDHFKQFNDKHGHIAGDEALRIVSRTILQNLRPVDMVTRYGGEELFALLPGLDLAATRTVAERLRETVKKAEIRLNNNSLLSTLTISIGIAQMQDKDKPEDLINAADNALYRAKHSGRNIVSE